MSEQAPVTKEPFVERLSDRLQSIVHAIVGSHRKPPRRLKSFLNGTWIGHPLHPAITDIPIAAWLITAVFDIIWLSQPQTMQWAAQAAEITLIIGLVGALGAVVTGFTDWSDAYGKERRVGLTHALFNAVATVLYVVSLVLRLTQPTGNSLFASIAGFVGLISLLYAAYLGGDLVFTHGTNVNHTAWEAAGEDYEPVLPVADVESGKLYRVTAAGVPVVILRQNEDFFAISATCPHAGAPLDEGTLNGDIIECPWHGSRFCMRDGRVLTGPATVPAPRYDVRIKDGKVEVKRISSH